MENKECEQEVERRNNVGPNLRKAAGSRRGGVRTRGERIQNRRAAGGHGGIRSQHPVDQQTDGDESIERNQKKLM